MKAMEMKAGVPLVNGLLKLADELAARVRAELADSGIRNDYRRTLDGQPTLSFSLTHGGPMRTIVVNAPSGDTWEIGVSANRVVIQRSRPLLPDFDTARLMKAVKKVQDLFADAKAHPEKYRGR